MPIYDYACAECGKTTTAYRSIANRNDGPECHGKMEIRISPVRGYVENIRYQSPIDNRPITSKRQRNDDLARNGCRPWEGIEQERKQASRNKEYEAQKFERSVEKWAGEAYHAMSPEKKQILNNAS